MMLLSRHGIIYINRSTKDAKDTESSGRIPQSASPREGSLTVFLVNGFQMHGVIRAYDGFTVVLDSDGRQQLIYKHAISTIIPPKPVELSREE